MLKIAVLISLTFSSLLWGGPSFGSGQALGPASSQGRDSGAASATASSGNDPGVTSECLHRAIREQNHEHVQLFSRLHGAVNRPDAHGNTPLYYAMVQDMPRLSYYLTNTSTMVRLQIAPPQILLRRYLEFRESYIQTLRILLNEGAQLTASEARKLSGSNEFPPLPELEQAVARALSQDS